MEQLVERIIEQSKKLQHELNPKQRFYREFDLALRRASIREQSATFHGQLERLETLGKAAGLPMSEIAQRKKTLIWAQAHAM